MEKEKSTKAVCPYCGGTRFLSKVYKLDTIMIDTDAAKVITIESDSAETTGVQHLPQPVCTTCRNLIPAYVMEDTFHQVICNPDYKDTVLHFIEPQELISYADLLEKQMTKDEAAELAFNRDRIPVIMVVSELYDFALRITFDITSEFTFKIVAKVTTVEPATDSHVQIVEHDIEVQTPAAVAGSYVFDFKGDTYQVLILTEHYPFDSQATQIDVERIISVTKGNTVANN